MLGHEDACEPIFGYPNMNVLVLIRLGSARVGLFVIGAQRTLRRWQRVSATEVLLLVGLTSSSQVSVGELSIE